MVWLSATLAAHLFAPESADRLAVLLELSHPSWSAPQRLSIGESVTSGGRLYRAYPVDVRLPEVSSDGLRPGQIALAARPDIVGMFRSVSTPIRLDTTLVFATSPDSPVRIFPRGVVRRPRVEDDRIHADVVWPAWAEFRAPRHDYTPADFPGLF